MPRKTLNCVHARAALVMSAALMASAAPVLAATNAPCSATSGSATTALVELFTSEGCDSCPPADAWFSKQASGDKAVLLAWHVDYWDRLGWRDRFAHAYATDRQRKLSALGGLRSIYTPQTTIHSKTIYFTDSSDVNKQQKAVNAQNSKVVLSVSLQPTAINSVAKQVQVSGHAQSPAGADTYLALVENGLSSQVSAGENRGVTLRHDHVVRSFAGPFKPGAYAAALTVPADSKLERLSVVAWAETKDGQALQALALPSVAKCLAEK
jgi:hypothetical protein